MSCFKLSEYLLHEIEVIISRFWWGDGSTKKIHWINWDSLYASERDGGMGFKDLSSFNQAMLEKQIWRLIQYLDSLLSRVLEAKYFPDCDVLDVGPNPNATFTWKSLVGDAVLVRSGTRWCIGSGNDVDAWEDNYLPNATSTKPVTPDMYQLGSNCCR